MSLDFRCPGRLLGLSRPLLGHFGRPRGLLGICTFLSRLDINMWHLGLSGDTGAAMESSGRPGNRYQSGGRGGD